MSSHILALPCPCQVGVGALYTPVQISLRHYLSIAWLRSGLDWLGLDFGDDRPQRPRAGARDGTDVEDEDFDGLVDC